MNAARIARAPHGNPMDHARSSSRLPLVLVGSSLLVGLAVSAGCEPRHKGAAVAPTATATATTVATAPTAAPTATTAPTATATTVATATTTAPTATATAPTATVPTPPVPPMGTWPTMPPGVDPAVLGDIASKAAAGLGIPVPAAGTPPVAGDPLEATIKAQAAKYAAGFTPAGPVGKAKLNQGQHAGMNINMAQGKCYVVLGAGGAGVTRLGLHVLFPATPPNAVMASDTAHGAQPVIGEGKPLCPPAAAAVRVDTELMQGGGDVAVQVWQK